MVFVKFRPVTPDALCTAYRLHISSPVASRRPLPDKGKPTVRWGRKVTGQAMSLTAGLPRKGELGRLGNGGPPQHRRIIVFPATSVSAPAPKIEISEALAAPIRSRIHRNSGSPVIVEKRW